MRNTKRHRTAFSAWAAVILAACASLAGCQPAGTDTVQKESRGDKAVVELPRIEILVETGRPEDAKAYYRETFDALGITHNVDSGEPGMALMLAYLGYPDVKPEDLENTPSPELMRRFGEDLLVSAFFAPKITDISQQGPANINVGWRKVIRLRAKPDSDAARHDIAAGFLLFNKFQGKDHSRDPFEERKDHSNESLTTQLILVRAKKGEGTDPIQRPLHFFVFGRATEGAKLKLALQASFDAAAPEVEAELAKKNPIKDYFVPIACGQCHGGLTEDPETGDPRVLFDRQKLNFLDTDHWFDRVQDGDDFAFIRTDNRFGVLFDGGTNAASTQFAEAFDVLRRLNREIEEQTRRVEPDPSRPSFQLRAVAKWHELHPSGDNAHKDVFARALPPLAGAGPTWDRAAEPDRTLLPLLNQYCYRCHSSIIYSLFDRHEVACRKARILNRLNRPPGSAGAMPQDRVLDPSVKARLLELSGRLPDAVQCTQ